MMRRRRIGGMMIMMILVVILPRSAGHKMPAVTVSSALFSSGSPEPGSHDN